MILQNPLSCCTSLGEAGIWGVNEMDDVFIRDGLTETNPSGNMWKKLSPPMFKQIDSGSRGIVYAVNKNDEILCRSGITTAKPEGTGWLTVEGRLKYVSCNVLGCYGVNSNNGVWYRAGVTEDNCVGVRWIQITGLYLAQIEVGAKQRKTKQIK